MTDNPNAQAVAELVKRLNAAVPYQGKSAVAFLCHEAADAISTLSRRNEELEAENARLRKAIADMANGFNIVGSHYDHASQSDTTHLLSTQANAERLRAAINGLDQSDEALVEELRRTIKQVVHTYPPHVKDPVSNCSAIVARAILPILHRVRREGMNETDREELQQSYFKQGFEAGKREGIEEAADWLRPRGIFGQRLADLLIRALEQTAEGDR